MRESEEVSIIQYPYDEKHTHLLRFFEKLESFYNPKAALDKNKYGGPPCQDEAFTEIAREIQETLVSIRKEKVYPPLRLISPPGSSPDEVS